MGQNAASSSASVARALIQAADYTPDIVKSLLYAFDRAWTDNAASFPDPKKAAVAQLMIAEAVLALASDGQHNMISLYVCAAARARDLAAGTVKVAQ